MVSGTGRIFLGSTVTQMAESFVLGISGVFFLGLPSLELHPMWSSECASLHCREDWEKFAVRLSFCDVHLITRLPSGYPSLWGPGMRQWPILLFDFNLFCRNIQKDGASASCFLYYVACWHLKFQSIKDFSNVTHLNQLFFFLSEWWAADSELYDKIRIANISLFTFKKAVLSFLASVANYFEYSVCYRTFICVLILFLWTNSLKHIDEICVGNGTIQWLWLY